MRFPFLLPILGLLISVSGRAVTNGQEVTKKGSSFLVSTVQIGMRAGEGMYSTCTGTLITRWHVLTAAHCISDMPAGWVRNKIAVRFPVNGYAGTGEVYGITDYRSGYYSQLELQDSPMMFGLRVSFAMQFNDAFLDDIAVLRLEKEAPPGYEPVVFANAFGGGILVTTKGQILHGGFGLNENESYNARINFTTAWAINGESGLLVLRSHIPGENICYGDSGGPVFARWFDKRLVQVGVNHQIRGAFQYGRTAGSCIHGDGAAAVDIWPLVPSIQDWVNQMSADLRPEVPRIKAVRI